jgi:guanylate kinase
MEKGKVIILSAPSGSGKTTIIHHLLEKDFNLHFSVSATNRAPRNHEVHAKDYFFLSTEDFKKKIHNNEFLEWEEVYPERFYGSLISEVDKHLENGRNVIFDVDVIGGLNIKKHYGQQALAIFVQTPDLNTLEKRLRTRNADNESDIQKRLEKATWEMKFANDFDFIIINDNLQDSLIKAETIVQNFLSKNHH